MQMTPDFGETAGERIELTFDCPESSNGLPVTQVYPTIKRFT